MFKRQIVIYLLLVVIVVLSGIIYFILKGGPQEPLPPQGLSLEEILKTLTAPGAGEVEKNTIKSLTAPNPK